MKTILLGCAIAAVAFAQSQDEKSEDLYPLHVGDVWTYRQKENRINNINKPIEHKIVVTVQRKVKISLRKSEVDAFEIKVVDSSANPRKEETRYAVVGKQDVRIYRKSGKGNEYLLLQTYPRRLPKEKSVKLGGQTYQVSRVEIDVPFGKVKGVKLSRKLGYDGHEGGEHIVLVPGIGVVSHSYDPGGELRPVYFGPKELVSFKKGDK